MKYDLNQIVLADCMDGDRWAKLRKGSYFNCLDCGSVFWRRPHAIKNGDNKFCSRECYFKWQKGKRKSPYNKDQSGDKNPNWKGGINPINANIRSSNKFKQWRSEVFKRDNWTCQKCGARSKKNKYVRIEAHHIKPFAKYPDLRFDVNNGITLCKKCHDKEPKGKCVYEI